MERIINEFRVIETEDGFRIEIKGDKEKMRSLVTGLGRHGRWHRWAGHRRGFGWGPFRFPFHPMMWMRAGWHGPWEHEAEQGEGEEEEPR